MFETLFARFEEKATQGLEKLADAKIQEAVARIDRKNDTLADNVRGATVTPVMENLQRDGNPELAAANAANSWQKPGMFAAAIVVAALLLRKLV